MTTAIPLANQSADFFLDNNKLQAWKKIMGQSKEIRQNKFEKDTNFGYLEFLAAMTKVLYQGTRLQLTSLQLTLRYC